MSRCSFCKKEYEPYPVFLGDNKISLFLELNFQELYYDQGVGVCESCRKKYFSDPVNLIRALLLVRLQILDVIGRLKEKGKNYSEYEEALKRLKNREKKLEKTPEVKALYMKNNPAVFKEPPKELIKCYFCGENNGQKWINDPNEEEPKIENCWWVCLTCERIIEKQEQHGMLMGMAEVIKEGGGKLTKKLDKDIKKLEKEIQDIAYEDGQSISCVSVTKEDDGSIKFKKHF